MRMLAVDQAKRALAALDVDWQTARVIDVGGTRQATARGMARPGCKRGLPLRPKQPMPK